MSANHINHIDIFRFKQLFSQGENLKQILNSCPNNVTNNDIVNLYYNHKLRLNDNVCIFSLIS